MSKRTRAFGPAAHNRRKSSRKAIPQYFLGGVAVSGLVLGCAWTVYTNVIGASIYPSVSSAAYEAPAASNTTTTVTIAPGGLNGSPFISSGNHSSEGATQSATRAPFGQATFFRRWSIDQS